MIQSFNGVELRYRKDMADSQRAVAVITHGICEHLGRYDYVTQKLNAKGISVYRYDLRGHGKSKGKRVYCEKYTDFLEDLDMMLEMARNENPDVPVYLIGHSLGGFITTAYATAYPGKANGVVLSGAFTRYTKPIFGPLPTAMADDTYIPNALGDGVCSDPAVIEAYNQDPLVEKEISAGIFNHAAPGLEFMKLQASDFTDPVLILHGGNDQIISEEDSRILFGEIGSSDKTLHIIAKFCHEIFNEIGKDKVIDEVIEWIEDRI